MHTPSELFQRLKNDELPDYAKEKKSFFGKLFSQKDWYKTMEFCRRTITRRAGEYRSQYIEKQLWSLIKEPKSLFDLTDQEYLDYQTKYKELIIHNAYLLESIDLYIQNNKLSGLDYRFVRYLLFFSSFRKQPPHLNGLRQVIKQFPEAYQLEIVLIILLGRMKSEGLTAAFDDLTHYKWTYPIIKSAYAKHSDWFHDFLIKKGDYEDSVYSRKAMQIFDLSEQEIDEIYEAGGWAKYKEIPLTDFEYFKKYDAAEELVKLEFCKLAYIRKYPNFSQKFNRETYLEQLDWTKEMVLNFINFAAKNSQAWRLPKAVLKAAEQYLKAGATDVLDALWQYYPKTKKHNSVEDQAVLKLLHQYANLRAVNTDAFVTLEQIISSGFTPVSPGYNQNIYKGMIPAQVRPFFQILRVVANVDIIKFYQDREKNHFVRFQIDGNQYDLPTTNGLGLSIIQPLNTLLFENNIPYQFVVYNRNGRARNIPFSQVQIYETGVTLVNQACYEQYNIYFMSSPITGFAQAQQPVVAFTQRIEELKPIQVRNDLDQIDLKNDPKFTVLHAELEKLPKLPVWTELLTHTLRYPLDAKPGKKWQTTAQDLVKKLGEADFQNGHVLILEKLTASDEWFQDTEKIRALRGMTWLAQLHPGGGQLYLLQKIASKAYRKVTGGAMNAKLGNIALETLAKIGTLEAFGVVNNLEAKAKYSVYKRAIKARKKKFTKLLKQYSPEELADRSVPSYQLVDGQKSMPVGDCEAVLTLEGFAIKVTWKTPTGKVQKSVPTHLKKDYAGEIKAVKAEGKSIVETLKAQARNLEKSWLLQRTWSYDNWQEFLLKHGLMRVMTEQLIWLATSDDSAISFLIKDSQTVDYQGNAIEIPANSTIRLWHPALATVEETLAWRTCLFDWTIKQPFKQAFREVYLLTPAEEATFDHSNRFAGHHLRGNTLYSLGKNREWTMTYEEPPILKLPHAGLVAVLNIRGGVLYSECQTMDLHFKTMNPEQKGYYIYGGEKVPLAKVPPVILSEIMRDVDLFVAVAGLGVDPYFDQNQTGTAMEYWRDASFGKKSQTAMSEVRKDLLGRLLPMTKIGKKCSFAGNFLEVKGSLREYKINLGSGNILMKPNDQYLCIVPGRNARLEKKIWLPFEGGDQTLMVILSKAFLLAEDEKITDETILRQINWK